MFMLDISNLPLQTLYDSPFQSEGGDTFSQGSLEGSEKSYSFFSFSNSGEVSKEAFTYLQRHSLSKKESEKCEFKAKDLKENLENQRSETPHSEDPQKLSSSPFLCTAPRQTPEEKYLQLKGNAPTPKKREEQRE